jgi:hypothetical protein
MFKNQISAAKSSAVSCFGDNKENAILMAKVEFGKTVLMQAKARLKSVTPIFLRGFIDSKYSDLVLANVYAIAQKYYLPGNAKAALLTDCVLKAGALGLGAGFDLPTKANDYINSVFSGINLDNLGFGEKKPAATAEEKAD